MAHFACITISFVDENNAIKIAKKIALWDRRIDVIPSRLTPGELVDGRSTSYWQFMLNIQSAIQRGTRELRESSDQKALPELFVWQELQE